MQSDTLSIKFASWAKCRQYCRAWCAQPIATTCKQVSCSWTLAPQSVGGVHLSCNMLDPPQPHVIWYAVYETRQLSAYRHWYTSHLIQSITLGCLIRSLIPIIWQAVHKLQHLGQVYITRYTPSDLHHGSAPSNMIVHECNQVSHSGVLAGQSVAGNSVPTICSVHIIHHLIGSC